MQWFWMIYLFIVGSTFGSFYNVVGLRIPKGQSIVKPRSHCTECERTLTSLDLIPIFSYLVLRGKCRGCETRISPIYLLVELVTGLLFAFSYYYFGWSAELLVSLVFMSLLMIILVSDIHYMIIPDKVLIVFGPIILLLRIIIAPLDPWWDSLLGAFVGFGLLFLIAVISRGGMGGGDIKLFGVIGLALGFVDVLLAFFFSCFYGTLIAGAGLILGKVKRGEPIPFGPYIVMGTITAYFFGDSLLQWYLQWL